jgi:hypothetical protein
MLIAWVTVYDFRVIFGSYWCSISDIISLTACNFNRHCEFVINPILASLCGKYKTLAPLCGEYKTLTLAEKMSFVQNTDRKSESKG